MLSTVRQTTHGLVRDAVRDAILGGELRPGMRLLQADLAQRFGVSTTPVREALRELVAEGLVTFDPYRGAVVHEPDLAEVREVYELRRLLEPYAARRVALTISDDMLDEAQTLADTMLDPNADTARRVQLNREFHALFDRAIGSPRLQGIIGNLRDSAMIMVSLVLQADPSQLSASDRDHAELVEACRRRDAESAARITERHLGTALANIEGIVEQGSAQAPSASSEGSP